jgi:hypothetical protein
MGADTKIPMYQREPVFSAIFDALALKHTKFNIN